MGFPTGELGSGLDGTAFVLTIGIVMSAIWWLGFGWTALTHFVQRPTLGRPEADKDKNIVSFGWSRAGLTAKMCWGRSAGRFLLSYFLYSDTYSTVGVVFVFILKCDSGDSPAHRVNKIEQKFN